MYKLLFYNMFYFMPLHVSSTITQPLVSSHLIIRRSKLHYTTYGIITPIGVMIPEAL